MIHMNLCLYMFLFFSFSFLSGGQDSSSREEDVCVYDLSAWKKSPPSREEYITKGRHQKEYIPYGVTQMIFLEEETRNFTDYDDFGERYIREEKEEQRRRLKEGSPRIRELLRKPTVNLSEEFSSLSDELSKKSQDALSDDFLRQPKVSIPLTAACLIPVVGAVIVTTLIYKQNKEEKQGKQGKK